MMKKFIKMLIPIIRKTSKGTKLSATNAMALIGSSYTVGGKFSGRNICMGRALGRISKLGYLIPVRTINSYGGRTTKIIEYIVV